MDDVQPFSCTEYTCNCSSSCNCCRSLASRPPTFFRCLGSFATSGARREGDNHRARSLEQLQLGLYSLSLAQQPSRQSSGHQETHRRVEFVVDFLQGHPRCPYSEHITRLRAASRHQGEGGGRGCSGGPRRWLHRSSLPASPPSNALVSVAAPRCTRVVQRRRRRQGSSPSYTLTLPATLVGSASAQMQPKSGRAHPSPPLVPQPGSSPARTTVRDELKSQR